MNGFVPEKTISFLFTNLKILKENLNDSEILSRSFLLKPPLPEDIVSLTGT
jgi:hypothetical protein